MNKKNTSSVKKDNKALMKKLSALQKVKEQTLKSFSKPQLQPFSRKAFTTSIKDYGDIHHNDYNTVIAEHTKKIEELKQKKEELEMNQCTFRPRINRNTNKYINSTNYIPIHERTHTSCSFIEDMNDEESINSIDNEKPDKVRKKIDPHFYEKQIYWEKQKIEKLKRKKMEGEINNQKEITNTPKLNNTKYISKNIANGFIERMESEKQKTECKKKQLEEKINDYSFQPRLNPNVNTRSRFMNPKKYAYQSLKNNYTYFE